MAEVNQTSSESTAAFNLLDEPWLPVRFLNGSVQELGIRDALMRSSDIREIVEPSPVNLIAIHRLLLAIVHRAIMVRYLTWKDRDRERWYAEGLPLIAIDAYLNTWQDRFWVFHPEWPFMQVAALRAAPETADKLKPWAQVSLAASCGNAPTLFDHSLDETPEPITVGEAVRHLLGFLQFTPGGLVKVLRGSDKAGPLSNTAAILPLGPTLEKTLALGLHPAGAPDDVPCWERASPTIADLQAEPTLATGPNDRYTRLSRAVLFSNEGTSHIRVLRFAAGMALAESPTAPDPMACYRIVKDHTIRLSFVEGRAVWRDLGALLPDPSGRSVVPAAILAWAANLEAIMGHPEAPVTVLVAGMASDQAKALRWRAERYVLPGVLLQDPQVSDWLRQKLGAATDVFAQLRGLAATLTAAAMAQPEHKETRAAARQSLDASGFAAAYFNPLERNFAQLLATIDAQDIDPVEAFWALALKGAAESAWRHVTGGLNHSNGRALAAQAKAYPAYRRLISSLGANQSKTVPPVQSETAIEETGA